VRNEKTSIREMGRKRRPGWRKKRRILRTGNKEEGFDEKVKIEAESVETEEKRVRNEDK
jgi:hypothetical protein